MRYTGETCPVCNQVFQEDDDIVVCPDCGTPHLSLIHISEPTRH